jgi:hypothetical protein
VIPVLNQPRKMPTRTQAITLACGTESPLVVVGKVRATCRRLDRAPARLGTRLSSMVELFTPHCAILESGELSGPSPCDCRPQVEENLALSDLDGHLEAAGEGDFL